MNARNKVFAILGLLTIGSLIWYFVTVRPTGDLQLIGTVDANEVVVGARITGRVQSLTVDEGQQVTAGQLIAVIESEDLKAATKAAEATASSQQFKIGETSETSAAASSARLGSWPRPENTRRCQKVLNWLASMPLACWSAASVLSGNTAMMMAWPGG